MSFTKRALVLGSSGFIGGHLVKSLIDDGYYVVGSDIRKINYELFSPSEFKLGDLRCKEFVESLFNVEEWFDEVYQLAADMGGATYINCGNYEGSVMSNSVVINSNVAKSASKYKVGKIFFASSACVYPHNDNDVASCNECDAYPAFPDNEYGWEKLFSERMYKGFERQYGLNVRIARFHSIVGDYSVCFGDRSKAHSALALKVALVEENGTIEVIGDGQQVRTFLYVKDCIKGVRALMNSNCEKIVNIGSDICVTINEYINMLKNISGKNFNIKYIDGPTGVKTRYCSIESIKNEIMWEPETTLEESSKITYNFIIDQLAIQQSKKAVIGFISQKIGVSSDNYSSYCGIGIRGKLTADILTNGQSTKYNFISSYIDNNNELEEFIIKNNPSILIYNYHGTTTPYLNDPTLRLKYNNIIHIMIHYDMTQDKVDYFHPNHFCGFNHIITDNEKLVKKSVDDTSIFIVTRSIPQSIKNNYDNETKQHEIPIIGFQGFGFPHKGIHRIAEQIQKEFDEAIFRLHIPFSYYGDPNGDSARQRVIEVKQIITKPGIKIEASHDFLSDEEIIKWLNSNTVNCYFYDYLENSGIASSPDYAIACRKPIAINNSRMFINLHDLTPTIEIEKTSLKQIIENGITPLVPLYEKYKPENVLRDYENICDVLLQNK
jgi:nucleoside-diphosphate-sugar epimerase